MKRRYIDAYYNLRSNTSIDRFNRHEWNNTFDAMDEWTNTCTIIFSEEEDWND